MMVKFNLEAYLYTGLINWPIWSIRYRVVQKIGYPALFGDNFGNSAPISTILSLLQAEIYGE